MMEFKGLNHQVIAEKDLKLKLAKQASDCLRRYELEYEKNLMLDDDETTILKDRIWSKMVKRATRRVDAYNLIMNA